MRNCQRRPPVDCRSFQLRYLHSTYTPESHLRWFIGSSIWGSEARRHLQEGISCNRTLPPDCLLLQHLAKNQLVSQYQYRQKKRWDGARNSLKLAKTNQDSQPFERIWTLCISVHPAVGMWRRCSVDHQRETTGRMRMNFARCSAW